MATSEIADIQSMRDMADSLRRIAARLPAELANEIERVASRLDQDAERLEAKIGRF
jgi:hypothetical protein